jgi:hypothetical protein
MHRPVLLLLSLIVVKKQGTGHMLGLVHLVLLLLLCNHQASIWCRRQR